MEKYGVHENQKPASHDEKQASSRPAQCPVCGKPLKVAGQVLLCPDHGSKPFEK